MDFKNDPPAKGGDFESYKIELDQVSASFCLAKWLQVTLDLKHGTNHSCHHPQRHAIPTEELRADSSALHNTSYKKECRKMMLDGRRPDECSFCWKVEDASRENISDRILKSSADWSWARLEEVRQLPAQQNINPSYVEIMFDNICNFSCIYCNADISTSIAAEMEEFGPLKTSLEGIRYGEGWIGFSHAEENPYVHAFWEWWQKLLPDLEVFRITGGEPLLSSQTFKVMGVLENSQLGRPLTIAINSNLGVPQSHFSKFVSRAKILSRQTKFLKFQIFTSVDSHGQQAEYIRWGLDYAQLFKRVDYLLHEIPQVEIIFMVTLSILSLPRLNLLLKDILQLKKIHGEKIKVDISHLVDPEYLSLKMIDSSLLSMLKSQLRYMEFHKGGLDSFLPQEIEKLSRIIKWVEVESTEHERNKTLRSDFYLFIKEYDHRKKKQFEEIFPELTQFFHYGRQYYEGQKEIFLQVRSKPELAASVLQSTPAVIYDLPLECVASVIMGIRSSAFDTESLFLRTSYAIRTMLIKAREQQNLILRSFLALENFHAQGMECEIDAFFTLERYILSITQCYKSELRDGEIADDFRQIQQLSLFSIILTIHFFRLRNFNMSEGRGHREHHDFWNFTYPSSAEDALNGILEEYFKFPSRYKHLSRLFKQSPHGRLNEIILSLERHIGSSAHSYLWEK